MHILEHGHHDHVHGEQSQITPAVLLAHTIEHNRNHLSELHDLISQLEPEVANKAKEALAKVEKAYEEFAKVFEEIKES